jgi:hypothetical protein
LNPRRQQFYEMPTTRQLKAKIGERESCPEIERRRTLPSFIGFASLFPPWLLEVVSDYFTGTRCCSSVNQRRTTRSFIAFPG